MMRALILIFFLSLSSLSSASTVNIRLGIKFGVGHSHIYENDDQVIKKMSEVHQKYPHSQIFITGHTDNTGGDLINQELSEARAKTVQSILTKYNVPVGSIRSRGYSDQAPIGDNETDEGRAKNRRVVVTFYNLTKEEAYALAYFITGNEDYKRIIKENPQVESDITALEEEVDPPEEQINDTVIEAEKPKKLSRYSFGLASYQSFIEAEDKETNILAEWTAPQQWSLEGVYQLNFGSFWLGGKLSYHLSEYEEEDSATYIWDEKSPNLIRVSLVSDYETEKYGIGFDLNFNQENFIYESSNEIEFKEVLMMGVSVRAQYKFFKKKRYTSRMGVSLDMPLFGSDDINPKGSLGYVGFVDLSKSKSLGNHGFKVKFYYGVRNFTNDQNDQNETVGGFLFSLDSLNWL